MEVDSNMICLSTLVAWSFYNVSDVINESGWELLEACGIINISYISPNPNTSHISCIMIHECKKEAVGEVKHKFDGDR